MSRSMVWVCVFVGSSIGSFIPELWGAGLFSFSSLFFSAAGALAGIWFAFKASGY
jgi:hypothetical protein